MDPRAQRERRFDVFSIVLNGVFDCILKQKCTRLVREKFIIFLYEQYTNRIVIYSSFLKLLCYEMEIGVYKKYVKM